MKLRWLALIFLVALAFFSTVAYAHPGKTDGKGGHINHSTGEYHYHHGYSEHQHYDMDGDGDVDCPYSFDDKTNHNGGITSSRSSNNTNNKGIIRSVLDSPLLTLLVCIAAFALIFFFMELWKTRNFKDAVRLWLYTVQEWMHTAILGVIFWGVIFLIVLSLIR